jgi:hypothetical protein
MEEIYNIDYYTDSSKYKDCGVKEILTDEYMVEDLNIYDLGEKLLTKGIPHSFLQNELVTGALWDGEPATINVLTYIYKDYLYTFTQYTLGSSHMYDVARIDASFLINNGVTGPAEYYDENGL